MNEPFHPGRLEGQSSNIALVATDTQALRRAQNGFAAAFLDPDQSFLLDDVGMDQLTGCAVWLEIGEDKGPQLDRWLMAFDAYAQQAEKPISVAMTLPMVDVVTARLEANMEFLVAPDTLCRAGAISDLYMRASFSAGVRETRGIEDAKRLQQLSDEVARIASTLSRLSSSEGGFDAAARTPSVSVSAPVSEGVPDIAVDTVRATIRARRMREKYFPADYFADPAWDMLLDLLAAEIAQHRVPVSSLCIAASVPATTALRWMKTLTDAGIFVRRADPHDGRRVFVELSSDASLALRRYFAELGGQCAA